MGWSGYGLYDGDGTFTLQLELLKKADLDISYVDNEDYWFEYKIKLNPEDKMTLIRAYPKLIKYLNPKEPKNSINAEDWAIGWQMFADLIMNSKLPMTKRIRTTALRANEILMGEHSSWFDDPSKRRATLRYFNTKLKNYHIKKR